MNTRTASIGREGILEVAETLFMERGYQAVSIRDIAQACGVTNAALYYHFPNKVALFREVLDQHATRLSNQMRAAGKEQDDHKSQLVAMLSEYAHLASGPRSAMFSLRREAKDLDRKEMHAQGKQLMLSMLAPLEEVFEDAIELGELESLGKDTSPAALLTGMLHALMMHRKACDFDTLSEEDLKMTVDILWKGMQS
ncbi:MAG: TetR/AcrR family transcriptional regulator [Chloroflexi bacterium]|nr:TetR/AcrR family transcriptional regulator [Chloroflexota bacterium]